MVLFWLSFLKKNSPDENSLFSLLNFLKVKLKVSTCNVAAPILLYSISYDLTTIISNNKLNIIGINIHVSRDLCVWCNFLCISHSLLAKSLSDCQVKRRFWSITPLPQRRSENSGLSRFIRLIQLAHSWLRLYMVDTDNDLIDWTRRL